MECSSSVLLQLRQFIVGTCAQQTDAAVVGQLVARIGDVEVAHGELADAVGRREDRVAFLYGQPLGVIGEVGQFGILLLLPRYLPLSLWLLPCYE